MTLSGHLLVKPVSVGRVVGPAIAAANEQSVYLPILSVKEYSAALPAGVINSVGARY